MDSREPAQLSPGRSPASPCGDGHNNGPSGDLPMSTGGVAGMLTWNSRLSRELLNQRILLRLCRGGIEE